MVDLAAIKAYPDGTIALFNKLAGLPSSKDAKQTCIENKSYGRSFCITPIM